MRALAIRHVEIEHLGLIERVLEALNFEFEYLDAYKNQSLNRSIRDYSLILVLGGPMGAYEEELYPFLKREFHIIAEAIKNRIPLLGICLGAQMIAKTLGAKVYRGENGKEIGWINVRKVANHELFSEFPDELRVLQWHQDTFDLPNGAHRIYSSKKYANQAFVFDKAVGLQFHIEVTREMVKQWAEVYSDDLSEEGLSKEEILEYSKRDEKFNAEMIESLISRLLNF
ncbi:MAG: gamma-glutamyl-gamma-aminobutyrate hydrolase family protein [Archaeoglobaceae archaeon]